MAMLAVAATSAFAQADALKEAKDLASQKKWGQAEKALKPALETGTSQQKAEAWNLQSEIKYQKYQKQYQIMVENQIKKTNEPYDTASMNKAAMGAIKAAIKCDEYDNEPNEKGKVKPKYRSTNSKKYFSFRSNLINPGLECFNSHDYEGAAKLWGTYIDSYSAPLFEKEDKSTDKNYTQIAYYASLACYNNKDYKKAKKYAKIAATDTAFVKDANEILLFTMKETATTQEDSLAYLKKLKQIYKEDPKNDRVFSLLIDYYGQPGRAAEKSEWLDGVLKSDPNNKMAWAIKGESAMNEQKYDEAIESFKKSVEIDPTFVQVYYNTGVCYYSKAVSMREQFADKRTGNIAPANKAKVDAVLNDAITYLTKAKDMDPDMLKTRWGYALYQAYYLLGDEAKSKEFEQYAN